MEDPTTLGLNLTFFGTLGLALLMSIGLGFLMVVTLVLAGVAKLVWIILLAMVGIFPKRDAVPVVHLPPRPRRAPAPPSDSEESTTAEDGVLGAGLLGTGPSVPRDPRPGFVGTARLLWSASWSAVRNFPWKPLVNPRTWPKPAQIKDGIAAAATAVATTQAKEHPFVVAVKQDPPVLNSQWAAAVAEADARAAAREAKRAKEASASDPEPVEGTVAESPEAAAPVREHRGEPHGAKPVSSARVTASAGARPRA